MSWLNDVMKQHEEYESPKNFWYWSALCSMSAVLRDNIYLDKFAYKMYPNIYVMLHADSGLRKGPPVAMANELVTTVGNTKMVTGRFSIQGLLKKLGTAESRPGGKIESVTSAFICSSELTSSIVEDKAATVILTALYDRNYNVGEWESVLKMENFTLNKPVVAMLGATNEAHFSNFFTGSDVRGGYIARTFVIYETERQTINSLMFPPKVRTDHKASAEYLKALAKLRGPVEMDESTRITFDKWYKGFVHAVSRNGLKDPTGALNRFDDNVLKIALLISLSSSLELKITQDAIDEAIEHCEKLIGNVRRTTMGSEPYEWVTHKTVLIQELIDRPENKISRQQFLSKHWTMANSRDWDIVAESLQEAGFISIEQMGPHIFYVMSEDKAMDWKKHFKGKN